MKDQSKTKQVLIQELVSLRHRIAELEQSESECKPAKDALRDRCQEDSKTVSEGISTKITGHTRTEMDLHLSEPNGQVILIVDDEPINLQLLSDILSEERYRIETAMNGRQALDAVGRTHPDIILLDVMMPEMDGYEVCRLLKESPETRDIPVIFITVKDQTEDIMKGFEAGAVDYIIKPFRLVELRARVRIHGELKKKRDNEKELIDRLAAALVKRNLAEQELIQAKGNLECLVKERTAELTRSKEQLVEEIEERVRAEDKLRLDSKILANMMEGVQLTRADDGIIVCTNPRFESLFGYNPGELLGKHVSIVNAPSEKSSEEIAKEIIKDLKQAGVWHGEVHNVRKDGISF